MIQEDRQGLARPPAGVRNDPKAYHRFVRRVERWLFEGDPRGAHWAQSLPDLANNHPPATQARGWVMRAAHLRRADDLDGAEAAYATACRLSPDDGFILARVCLLHMQRGRTEAARAAVERGVRCTSGEDHALALTNRGQIRLLTGDHSGAVADFCGVVTAGKPGWPTVTAAVINLAFALSRAGHVGAAHALDVARFARRTLRGPYRTLLRNRLAWIEALAWAQLGHNDRAARKLRRVIARARELGASTDAALAAIDHYEITGGPRERKRLVMGWPTSKTSSTGVDLAKHLDDIIGDMPANTDRAAVATLHKLLDQARAGTELAQLAQLRKPLARFAQRRVR